MADERVEFDLDTVTVEEAELLEETVGIPWLDCVGTKAGMAKVMRGFVWLHQRRTDPDLKFSDVKFNITRFGQELGLPEEPATTDEGEADPDPLPEASDTSGTPSTSSSTRSTESNPGKSDSSPSSNSKDAVPVSSP